MVEFHGTLSERTVWLRYFHAMKTSTRVAHQRLTRLCFTDFDREMVLVADHKNRDAGDHEIRGVGRLSKVRGTNEAEFALVVSDRFQGLGPGHQAPRTPAPDRPRREHRPDLRPHPCREHRDEAHLRKVRIPSGSRHRRLGDRGRDRALNPPNSTANWGDGTDYARRSRRILLVQNLISFRSKIAVGENVFVAPATRCRISNLCRAQSLDPHVARFVVIIRPNLGDRTPGALAASG